MKDNLQYAAIAIVVIKVMLDFKLFVRPEKLEKMHGQIMADVENKFLSLQAFKLFKEGVDTNFSELKKGVNDIITILMSRKDK